VNEYVDGQGEPIYHFDFYRIKKEQEVLDIGYEDYVYSGYVCFMEWPELIENLLPDDTVRVVIEEEMDGSRKILF
jgi:tRNA threonylcarbamoyladenosine biosynthesis protein TsaE